MPKQQRIDDTPVPTRFSPRELEMLEVIRHEHLLPTRSAAIRKAVRFMYYALTEESDG